MSATRSSVRPLDVAVHRRTSWRSRDRWRVSGFLVEAVALFGAIVVVRAAAPQLGEVGEGLSHPFWIPVILLSILYGFWGAFTVAGAATGLYVWLDLPLVPMASGTHPLDPLLLPSLWFGTALVLAWLMEREFARRRSIEDELEKVRSQALWLSDALERSMASAAQLERQIAADARSTLMLLRDLPSIGPLSGRQLVVEISPYLAKSVRARDIAIYLRQDGRLLLAAARGRRATTARRSLHASASLQHDGDGCPVAEAICTLRGERVGLIVLYEAEAGVSREEACARLQLAAAVLAGLRDARTDPAPGRARERSVGDGWIFPSTS